VNLLLLAPLILVTASADPSNVENPVFEELLSNGVKMSDGTAVKLPAPILADGLDAAEQRAAIGKVADARSQFADLVKQSYYTPVVVKVRTLKASSEKGPVVRNVDIWFVVRGDWDVLTSKDFLETALKSKEQGTSRVVRQSGILTEKQMAARKLSATVRDNYEERYPYLTLWLFERVEISSTRFAILTRNKQSILAAARLDSCFLRDKDFPNQWRPLLRDERAEIKTGPTHPFDHAGGYAKITRLVEPADGVLIELHMVYEEPYGWFDGVNLVRQKVPAMVQEKVRVLRRKLTIASGEKSPHKSTAE
jgi:hypothetical protein